jgi:hypothetical protein
MHEHVHNVKDVIRLAVVYSYKNTFPFTMGGVLAVSIVRLYLLYNLQKEIKDGIHLVRLGISQDFELDS